MLSNQIKIIFGLFAFAVVLIFANLLYNTFSEDEKLVEGTLKKFDNISEKSGIEYKFKQILSSRGIKTEWIIEKKNKKFKVFEIKIPKDLTIHELIVDISTQLTNDSISIKTSELVEKKKIRLQVFSKNQQIIDSYFQKDEFIMRDSPRIVFLTKINSIEEIGQIENDFFKRITFLININEFNRVNRNLKYDYAILFNDLIVEPKYKLEESMGKKEIRNSILRILNNFGWETPIYIDSESNLSKSVEFSYIKEFLNTNKVEFNYLKKIKNLTELDKKEFQAIVNLRILHKKSEIFIVDLETLENSRDFIIQLKKRGVKFLSLSEEKSTTENEISK